jgi:hypothetical protein
MKSHKLLTITMALLLCFSCGTNEKKDNPVPSATDEPLSLETSKEKGISLEQKGDYTQLYNTSENCKLTMAKLAEALGVNESQIVEKNKYKGNCWYDVTTSENITIGYGVSLRTWPEGMVAQEIRSAMKNELIDIQLSETGDTYITRHPAQGYLLLLNPNYNNTIKVSYRYFNPEGPKLTEAQQEERKQNTYKIANYLINQYNK